MSMASNLTEIIEAAMVDGEQLVPWAAPNTIATEDEHVEAALLRALGGPVPTELAIGVPLWRWADTSVPVLPLVQALISDVRHTPTSCDRCGCGRDVRSITDRLVIPAGASVVAMHFCWRCKITLDRPYGPGHTLVWS